MKDWIKVHGITFDDKIQEQWVRSSDVMAVGRGTLASDEKRKATCITLRGDSSTYPVTESIRKVLDLIDIAENSSLYRKLKEAKATCQDIKTLYEGGCDEDCPYWHGKNAWLCDALNHTAPEYWELEKIPEEYR